MRLSSIHALGLGVLLVACGGKAATPATPAQRGGASCPVVQALVAPTPDSAVQGYGTAVECDASTCVLAVTHGAIAQRHALDREPARHEVAATLLELDGDGNDELVVQVTHVAELGPHGEMEIIDRDLFVLDAESLELRWSASSWSSDPPEPQSTACASTAELRDEDCDGRRETLIQTRRCDAPMCAGIRAGQPEDSDYVRDACGSITPSEEQGRFRAARPGVIFAAT